MMIDSKVSTRVKCFKTTKNENFIDYLHQERKINQKNIFENYRENLKEPLPLIDENIINPALSSLIHFLQANDYPDLALLLMKSQLNFNTIIDASLELANLIFHKKVDEERFPIQEFVRWLAFLYNKSSSERVLIILSKVIVRNTTKTIDRIILNQEPNDDFHITTNQVCYSLSLALETHFLSYSIKIVANIFGIGKIILSHDNDCLNCLLLLCQVVSEPNFSEPKLLSIFLPELIAKLFQAKDRILYYIILLIDSCMKILKVLPKELNNGKIINFLLSKLGNEENLGVDMNILSIFANYLYYDETFVGIFIEDKTIFTKELVINIPEFLIFLYNIVVCYPKYSDIILGSTYHQKLICLLLEPDETISKYSLKILEIIIITKGNEYLIFLIGNNFLPIFHKMISIKTGTILKHYFIILNYFIELLTNNIYTNLVPSFLDLKFGELCLQKAKEQKSLKLSLFIFEIISKINVISNQKRQNN